MNSEYQTPHPDPRIVTIQIFYIRRKITWSGVVLDLSIPDLCLHLYYEACS